MAGGAAMVIIGILYLTFENFVLAGFQTKTVPEKTNDRILPRTLAGIQVLSSNIHKMQQCLLT